MLVELCALLKPRLTIMDAVVGMEGNGPGSGDPRQIGLVIAGQDPVAVDVVSGSVVGVAVRKGFPLSGRLPQQVIGETRLDRIRSSETALSGMEINTFAFRRRRTSNGVFRNGRGGRSRTP